jgi:hypothetical protein
MGLVGLAPKSSTTGPIAPTAPKWMWAAVGAPESPENSRSLTVMLVLAAFTSTVALPMAEAPPVPQVGTSAPGVSSTS